MKEKRFIELRVYVPDYFTQQEALNLGERLKDHLYDEGDNSNGDFWGEVEDVTYEVHHTLVPEAGEAEAENFRLLGVEVFDDRPETLELVEGALAQLQQAPEQAPCLHCGDQLPEDGAFAPYCSYPCETGHGDEEVLPEALCSCDEAEAGHEHCLHCDCVLTQYEDRLCDSCRDE